MNVWQIARSDRNPVPGQRKTEEMGEKPDVLVLVGEAGGERMKKNDDEE